MLKWQAVWFGVAVAVLLAFGGVFVPVVGHAAIGLAAGFVAGVLAGGGARTGVEHGTTTGVIAGLVTVVVGGALGLAVGFDAVVPAAIQRLLPYAVGDPSVVVAGAALLVACSVLAGGVGGWVRGTREFPGRIRQERAER